MDQNNFFSSLKSDLAKKASAELEETQQYAERRKAATAFVAAVEPLLESYKLNLQDTGVSCLHMCRNDYFHVSISFPTQDPIGRDTTYQLQMEPDGMYYRWVKEFPGNGGRRTRSIGELVKVEEITTDEFEKLLQGFIKDSSFWALKM